MRCVQQLHEWRLNRKWEGEGSPLSVGVINWKVEVTERSWEFCLMRCKDTRWAICQIPAAARLRPVLWTNMQQAQRKQNKDLTIDLFISYKWQTKSSWHGKTLLSISEDSFTDHIRSAKMYPLCFWTCIQKRILKNSIYFSYLTVILWKLVPIISFHILKIRFY